MALSFRECTTTVSVVELGTSCRQMVILILVLLRTESSMVTVHFTGFVITRCMWGSGTVVFLMVREFI